MLPLACHQTPGPRPIKDDRESGVVPLEELPARSLCSLTGASRTPRAGRSYRVEFAFPSKVLRTAAYRLVLSLVIGTAATTRPAWWQRSGARRRSATGATSSLFAWQFPARDDRAIYGNGDCATGPTRPAMTASATSSTSSTSAPSTIFTTRHGARRHRARPRQ